MSTQLLPDVESMVIAYLADHADVDDLVDGRVYAEPFDRVTWPFVTVRRIGGRVTNHHWIDRAQIEVAGWAEDHSGISGRQAAHAICETAIAALHDMPMEDPQGAVVNVEDAGGPTSRPDPVTSSPRFVAEVFVTVHPPRSTGS